MIIMIVIINYVWKIDIFPAPNIDWTSDDDDFK